MTMPDIATPYAGTSGHQGYASQDAEPSRRRWQPKVKALLFERGSYGVTMQEACDLLQGTHQSVSSALSNLHYVGTITRLTQKRGGGGVYVLNEPHYIQGRDTIEHRANRRRPAKQVGRDQIAMEVHTWMQAPDEHEEHLIDRINRLINGGPTA